MLEDYANLLMIGGAALVVLMLFRSLVRLALLIAGAGVLAFAAHAAGLF